MPNSKNFPAKHIIPPSEPELHIQSESCQCEPVLINNCWVHGGMKEFVVNIFDTEILNLFEEPNLN